jgi:hypothetical protein
MLLNFGGMKVVFHLCKPNIYNLPILNPNKIPRFNGLNPTPFNDPPLRVVTNLMKLGLFNLSKTSNCFRVKRIVVGCSSSFS